MCLYPKLIQNRKYKANKKNGGNIPEIKDFRTLWVAVGCGKCKECRNQKKRNWQIRLHEEIRNDNTGVFVTLTFSPEELTKLMRECNDIEGNAVATLAVRRFLERWRKEFKKSVKHWLITELGHNNTERIHIHGIIFTDKVKEIVKHWKYGNVTIGKTMFKNEDWQKANKLTSYVSARTVNYIVKYVTKIDSINKGFEGKILCSAGLGKNYLSKFDSKQNRFKGNETNENYKLPNGANVNLPIYYRNKIYTEEEREQLWVNKLDLQKRFILGRAYNVRNEKEEEIFLKGLEEAQKENKRLGYGDDSEEFKTKKYNITLKMLRNNNKRHEINSKYLKSNKNI